MSYSTGGPVPREFDVEIDGMCFRSRTITGIFDQYVRSYDRRGIRLPADWEDWVWSHLAARYPKHVKRVPGASKRRSVSVRSALNFIRFLGKRLTDKRLVAPEEARRRAAICASCPMATHVSGCAICKDVLQLAVHPPEVVSVPEACSACGCHIPLKVWVPRDLLGSADDFDYWESCWMRE
jgi:hypothetical protein